VGVIARLALIYTYMLIWLKEKETKLYEKEGKMHTSSQNQNLLVFRHCYHPCLRVIHSDTFSDTQLQYKYCIMISISLGIGMYHMCRQGRSCLPNYYLLRWGDKFCDKQVCYPFILLLLLFIIIIWVYINPKMQPLLPLDSLWHHFCLKRLLREVLVIK
jgi:hypothetical protein